MRVLAVVPLFALIGAACSHGPTTSSPGSTVAEITPADLERRLNIIAHDSMMGRETGSEGDYKTAAYIASQFQKLGLEPAGENDTYFQTVPFRLLAADRASRITVGATTLQLARDFIPAGSPQPTRTFENAQAIYGGPINDTARWIAPDKAAGHIVVLDIPVNGPARVPINPTRFPGAIALAIVGLETTAPEQLARVVEGRPVRDSTFAQGGVPALYITRRAASVMLGASPQSFKIGQTGPTLNATFGFTNTPVRFAARNVVGILRGSDPLLRDQYVALTAHNDHVGFDHMPVDHDSVRAFDRVIRPMGADSPPRKPSSVEWAGIRVILDSLRKVHRPRLDSIRNGADDDGSGTVSILEIAEAMSRGKVRPRRSILFVSHTAEEAGLMGSAWYTDHPTVPVDSIVAEIDQDMVGRGLPSDFPRGRGTIAADAKYLEVVGDEKLSKQFAAALDAANARQPLPFEFDRSYAAPGHPLQYYCRADHYNYARYGIPAVALSRGEHLDYHQVTDEAQYIDYTDLARVTKLVYDAAMSIANADHRFVLDVPKPINPHAACRQ
jgi:hypothetical protein